MAPRTFVLKVCNSYTDGGRLVFKMGRWVSRRPARGHRSVSCTKHPPPLWPRAGEWAADPKGHWGVSWPPTHAGPSGGKCVVVVGVVVVVAAVVVAVAFVLKSV